MKLIKTIISNVSLISFISLISFVSLVSSCSKSDDFVDDGQNQNPVGVVIGGVSGYATSFAEENDTKASGTYNPYKALTRAWVLPDEIKSDYVDYESGAQPIAIAFTQDTKTPMMRYLIKGDEEWRISKIEGIGTGNYQLYGYIPNITGIKYSITDLDETNASYSTGSIMTLEDVPSVMSQDFCVLIGAKHGFDKEHDGEYTDENGNTSYDEDTDTRTNRLRQGDFTYKASGEPLKDYYFLLFDHLYAALRVRMRVYDKYAELRTIKLKSLQLDTQAGETKTTKKTKVTIKLKANKVNGDPIEDEELTFTPTGDPIDGGLEFWSNTTGTLLTTDFQPFIGHFMPDGITKLILTSTYDVYDTKGNLIREDCKSTNSVLLSELFSGQTMSQRGKRYTVNMTIQPTYLYMLSEPDLDDPKVIIN